MSNKNTFFTGQPVFSQLLKLIPTSLIGQLAKKHEANRYCKTFMAYDHLVTMLYQGLFQCLSLRELTTGLLANAERLRHLGLVHTPRRSTLADANTRRSADFFQDLYHGIYKLYYPGLPDSRLKGELYIIDSTTISLFTSIMKGAGDYKADGRKKGGAKAHVLLDATHNIPCFVRITESCQNDLVFLKEVHIPPDSIVVFDKAYINYSKFKEWSDQNITWVTRQKNDASFIVEKENEVSKASLEAGVLSDEQILLGRAGNERVTPQLKARRIKYKDPLTQKEFIFITNSQELQATDVAAIYKRRWQIELLFKRIKQRYNLRYFLGESENAIRIQIWSMLICDLLVQIVLNQINNLKGKRWSYANLAAMIKHHLMTYIHLLNFLKNPEKALLNYRHPHIKTGTLF